MFLGSGIKVVSGVSAIVEELVHHFIKSSTWLSLK